MNPNGRPRSADSLRDIAERYGISRTSARRLRRLNLNEEATTIWINGLRHLVAVIHGEAMPYGMLKDRPKCMQFNQNESEALERSAPGLLSSGPAHKTT